MPTEIDSLQIKINAEASKANTAIDNLITKIDTLTTSLTGLNGDSLTSLARGTRDFGSAMQLFRDTKAVDFNKIARGISKFSTIDSTSFKNISEGLIGLSGGLEKVSAVDNLGGISKVVNSIKSLSSVDMSRFDTVAFANVGNSIRDFTHSLSSIGNVDKNIVSLVNSVSRLSSSGKNIENVSKEFPAIANQIYGFVNQLNGLNINFDVSGLANLIGNIRNLGGKVATNAITTIPQLAKAMNSLMTTLSQSPQVSQNVIQMTNALANLSAQGSKVGNSTRSIQRGLNNASRSATKATFSFKSLASIFGTFYANAFLLIRGIKGLYSAIESTADYIEAFNYFNVALGKIGKDWSFQFEKYGYDSAEAYADSFSERLREKLKGLSGLKIELNADGSGLLSETGLENLGLNIKEVTQYASQLSSVTNSVGQVGEVSLATASSITKLGADLSSLFNIDYSTAMEKLQSGLIGQSRALYSFGIDITNASLQTLAYELGVEKAVSEMTQAEKMQLRLIAILRQSKVAWGDLANTINSPSNMMRQFSNNLKETGMVLGQLFIPVLQKVMPIINGVTIAIKRLLVSIASLLGIKLDLQGFGQGYSGLGEEIGGVADSLDDATAAAKKFKTYALGIDELNIQPEQSESSGSGAGGVGGGIDLTDEILQATSEYEKAWQEAFDKMESKAQVFADKIAEYFKPITNPFSNLDFETITTNIKELSTALEPWADNFGEGFIEFWGDVSETTAGIIEKLFGEDGTIIKVTDWLNSNDSEKAKNWGYAFGELSLGLGAIVAVAGAASLITKLATSLSFLGPALAIVAAAYAGLKGGLWLGKKLFPEDVKWYENFKLFGDGGFLDEIFKNPFRTLEAYYKMIEDNPISSFAVALSGLSDYLDITISGLEKATSLFDEGGFKTILDYSAEFYSGVFSAVKNGIQSDFEEISILFSAETWSAMFENARSGIQTKWEEIVEWWNDSAIGNWFNQSVKPWFSKEKWSNLLSSIPEVFSQAFKSGANLAIGFLNKIIEGIESLINGAISALSTAEDLLNKIPGIELSFNIPEITLPRIPTYQTGGFPEDGLFMANRGELVGKFSNGKTAVANNEQIVAGIEYGVERAVERALAPYLSDIARNTRETADKDMSVNIGDRDIARANARGSRSLGYALIT